MQKTLLVYLHDVTLNSVSWIMYDNEGTVAAEAQVGNIKDLSALSSGGHKVALIIPSTQLTFSKVQLPTTDRERMLRALPFAMEDRIVDDVANMHFSVHSWDNHQAYLSAISRQDIDSLLERFTNAGVSLDYLVPDIFLTPFEKGSWTVLITNKYALVRTDEFSGFSLDNDNLQQGLNLNLSQETTLPGSITVIHQIDVEDFTAEKLLPEFNEIPVVNKTFENKYITLFQKQFSDNLPFNLLQGSYSKHEQLTHIWHAWRPVAALFAIILVLYTLSISFDIYNLNQKISVVDNKIVSIFKKTLPNSKRIVNPKAQLQQKIAELQSNTDQPESSFLLLLGKSVNSFTRNKNIKLNSMTYDDGKLDIELVIDTFQNLDALKSNIESEGIIAEILSASADESSILGRIRLSNIKPDRNKTGGES